MENLKNEAGFNSTTVQLIHERVCERHPPVGGFNSTTVQLIHTLPLKKHTYIQFQFHNGTINTYSKK